ncbi:MAG: hypothetical protein MJB14_12195 [Spirochaetes bacterium]|nr:hypothetical protein [Spirochaetota bacterium]
MIKKAILFLLSIIILINCSKSKDLDILPFTEFSESEENDTIDAAIEVDPDQEIVGLFNAKPTAGDRDFYLLKFSNRGTAYQMVQTAVPMIDSKISFYDQQKRFLFRIDGSGIGQAEKFWNFQPKSDQIYMLVEAKKGSNSQVPYIINFISKEADNRQEVEPNNTIKDAVPIKLGEIKKGYITPKGDIDYYQILIDEEQIYDFSVEVETLSNLDINLGMRGGGGGGGGGINSASWGGSEKFLFLSNQKGEYYLRISGNISTNNQKDPLYYLSINEELSENEKPIYFEREFNDKKESATEILPGEEIKGVILTNDQDWFKVDLLKKSKSLDVSLSKHSGEIPLIEIYKTDGTLVTQNNHSTSITARNLAEGRYYIKLSSSLKKQIFYQLFINVRYSK